MNLPKPEDLQKMAQELAPIMALWIREINTPLFQEKMLAIAMERRVKYKAHIKVGFTEAQALDLCSK